MGVLVLLLLLLEELLPQVLLQARRRLRRDGGLDRPRLVAPGRSSRRKAAPAPGTKAPGGHHLLSLIAGRRLLMRLLLQQQHLLLELELGVQLRLLQLQLLLHLLLLLLLLMALRPQMQTQLLRNTLSVLRWQGRLRVQRGQRQLLVRVHASAGHAQRVLQLWRVLRGLDMCLRKLRDLRSKRLQLLLRGHLLA